MNEKKALDMANKIRQEENERLANMSEDERREDYKKTNQDMADLAKQIGIPVVKVKNIKK